MNRPCDHGRPIAECLECCYAALCQAYQTNANLHRRAQAGEGAADRVDALVRGLRHSEAVLAERKTQINLLGFAWSLRGYRTKEEAMTTEEVKRLVANVDRIQRRHFNHEYRLMYGSLDDQVRARIEGLEKSSATAWGAVSKGYFRARRWKALAKRLAARSRSEEL